MSVTGNRGEQVELDIDRADELDIQDRSREQTRFQTDPSRRIAEVHIDTDFTLASGTSNGTSIYEISNDGDQSVYITDVRFLSHDKNATGDPCWNGFSDDYPGMAPSARSVLSTAAFRLGEETGDYGHYSDSLGGWELPPGASVFPWHNYSNQSADAADYYFRFWLRALTFEPKEALPTGITGIDSG